MRTRYLEIVTHDFSHSCKSGRVAQRKGRSVAHDIVPQARMSS
ncbi:MAG: hypothetical protein RI949_846 [Pseudomonadota bacterium]